MATLSRVFELMFLLLLLAAAVYADEQGASAACEWMGLRCYTWSGLALLALAAVIVWRADV